jgi:hypothetical protein
MRIATHYIFKIRLQILFQSLSTGVIVGLMRDRINQVYSAALTRRGLAPGFAAWSATATAMGELVGNFGGCNLDRLIGRLPVGKLGCEFEAGDCREREKNAHKSG